MLITNHQCQVAGHAPLSRPWQPGRPGWHIRDSDGQAPGAQYAGYYDSEDSLAPGHRVTVARPAETARLAAESHCTGRTRLGLGLRRVGETPRVSPDRPASESESDPGPGPSPIGRPYDSDSSKGHWHDPPTLLVRAAPGADSARPGETREARREKYHRNITRKYRVIYQYFSPGQYRGRRIIAGRAGLNKF